MNLHVAHINAIGLSAADYAAAVERERTIREMAMHLIAGVTGALDLSCDRDVIQYLRETPERYRARTIMMHIDGAVHLARETIALAAEGLR